MKQSTALDDGQSSRMSLAVVSQLNRPVMRCGANSSSCTRMAPGNGLEVSSNHTTTSGAFAFNQIPSSLQMSQLKAYKPPFNTSVRTWGTGSPFVGHILAQSSLNSISDLRELRGLAFPVTRALYCVGDWTRIPYTYLNFLSTRINAYPRMFIEMVDPSITPRSPISSGTLKSRAR